jgi:CBS domain-containing protein
MTLSTAKRLFLKAATAEELMSNNPVSIHQDASLLEAAALLTDREIGAAPVIDDAGRPVGVISRSDIVRYDREHMTTLAPMPEYYDRNDLVLSSGEMLKGGFQVTKPDVTLVRDVMTPVVISVDPEDSISVVISQLLALKVHRLFVVDRAGVLVGVISTFDVLRNLRAEED